MESNLKKVWAHCIVPPPAPLGLNFEIPAALVFQLEVLLLNKLEQLLDCIQIKHLYLLLVKTVQKEC